MKQTYQEQIKIYVSSSWKNTYHDEVIEALKELPSVSIYNYRDLGFTWRKVLDKEKKDWTLEDYKNALKHEISEKVYDSHLQAIEECDIFILLLPAGLSCGVEFGIARLHAASVITFVPDSLENYDLMLKESDHFVNSIDSLITSIKEDFEI